MTNKTDRSKAPKRTTQSTAATRAAAHEKRTLGEDAVPARGHSADHIPDDYRDIAGWGVDLDPKNRPSYPKELPSSVLTARGDVNHRQEPTTKIHQSNEHPDLTPVFGTSCPPAGLSGALRDYAYQFGEATNRHWLTLMLADRIDIAESMVTSALRGRPDHYLQEKQWGTRLRHRSQEDPRRLLMFGAMALSAVAVGVVLATRDRD
jgi:hypothetical protein